MRAVAVEHVVFVGERASDEAFLLLLSNDSAAPAACAEGFPFEWTDSRDEVLVSASDGLVEPMDSADPEHLDLGRHELDFLVWICPRGILGPGEERMVGARVRRSGRGWVDRDEAYWDDPFRHYGALTPTSPASVPTTYTVVFPADGRRRNVVGPGARCTSRTASLDMLPSAAGSYAMQASCTVQRQSVWIRWFDDVIAELYGLMVASGTGGDMRPSAAREALERVLDTIELRDPDRTKLLNVLTSIEQVDGLSIVERHRRLRGLVEELMDLRSAVRAARPPARYGDDVQLVADHALRQVDDLRASVDGMPEPPQLREALLEVLQFAAWCKRQDPAMWPANLRERNFQDKFAAVVGARVPGLTGVLREAEVAQGTVDFMLLEVATELKTKELGPQHMRAIGEHSQQIADYAARQGQGVGILLGLDVTDWRRARRATMASPPEQRLSQPPLLHQSRVDLVASSNLDRPASTIVISIVVAALPPAPSSLRGERFTD